MLRCVGKQKPQSQQRRAVKQFIRAFTLWVFCKINSTQRFFVSRWVPSRLRVCVCVCVNNLCTVCRSECSESASRFYEMLKLICILQTTDFMRFIRCAVNAFLSIFVFFAYKSPKKTKKWHYANVFLFLNNTFLLKLVMNIYFNYSKGQIISERQCQVVLQQTSLKLE